MTQPSPQHPTPDTAEAEVRVEPLGEVLHVRPGEPLMSAAVRHGLRWPTVCKGSGLCGACFVRVVTAAVAPEPPTARELATLKMVPPHRQGPDVRLACQLLPRGAMTVERTGVVRRNG